MENCLGRQTLSFTLIPLPITAPVMVRFCLCALRDALKINVFRKNVESFSTHDFYKQKSGVF